MTPRHPTARVISVNISSGGIPRRPVGQVFVSRNGLFGDGRSHACHIKPSRAVSLLDERVILALQTEGYVVGAGTMGENLTVRGLDVDHMKVNTCLRFTGGVEIELTERRVPCLLLDSIDPTLKTAVLGRFGFMARVITEGHLRRGAAVEVISEVSSQAM